MKTIIKNATIVNENRIFESDLLISGERIAKIEKTIDISNARKIDAKGFYLLPGVIDDHVHFREPGLTKKATIYSESKAAVAGGITSYMEMPNTIPNTLTQKLLEEKYNLAAKNSLANYSFFMGISKDNLEEALKIDPENVCGISDDGLYFNNEKGILANYPDFLEILFSRTNMLIALHSEDDAIIQKNTEKYRKIFGDDIPVSFHSLIRNEKACLKATKRVLNIAKRYNNRLHLLHISTLAEAKLFDNKIPVQQKRITAEACVHHLCFSDKDYQTLGDKIKWNPSIKKESDRNGLLQSLLENRLDIIATDHAPHRIEEKGGNYFQSFSGGPLVQHALPAILEFFHEGKMSLGKIVEKMSHNVSEIYRIKERGYIREGYYADLVLIDINSQWKVTSDNILYKCKWSPFENHKFQSKILKTFVNGNLVYDNGIFFENQNGKRLYFSKNR